MIQAFDDFTKQVTGKNIDQHIDGLKHDKRRVYSYQHRN